MQYHKLICGETIIEFHNNWLGQETVIVNGQVVSKESSVWGVSHYFTQIEDGHTVRYILTSRVNESMQPILDLSKNGELIHKAVVVKFGKRPKEPHVKAKKEGLQFLKEYDLEDALESFKTALKINPKDAECYFHMACIFSIQEDTREGFECLKKAVANGLPNQESILDHDLLAFLRMNPAFEDFLNSGFTKYQLDENAEASIDRLDDLATNNS